MTMPEYFGAARLLVETHNKYLKLLVYDNFHGEGIDDAQAEMMESFVSDFNRISKHYEIRSTGRGAYGLFDREGVPL